jgi:hypothetical protein
MNQDKLNVICYVRSAGINVNYENFKDTIISIKSNINTNFKFYIDTDKIEHKIKFTEIINENNLSDYILELRVMDSSWAGCFNKFFTENKNLTEYILVSHDDVNVRTFDFFNITMNEISGHEDEIAWIGFTSDSYYRLRGSYTSQSAREVFCKDRLNFPRVFEVHNPSIGLDMPKKTCKVPGIYSHFNLIKTTSLEKIGLCPDWGNYTLLIDEHWSLQTLINNLWTVWVPNVFYDHPLRYEERKFQGLQNQPHTTQCFISHWGIRPDSLSDDEINKFCEKFPNTNISFFNNKNSYDYQYLKN